MKKNNKGFFLAEAIIIIALVTTVMAFVYPNVSKLYENYKNSVDYYDQPEDLYTLKAVYDYMKTEETTDLEGNSKNYIEYYTDSGCKEYNDNDSNTDIINDNKLNIIKTNDNQKYIEFNYNANSSKYKIEKLYITGYMTNFSVTGDDEFNRYLKRLKKTTNDKASYRLIGVFEKDNIEKDNIKRYASIKIDNPNPNRNCNLGG